MKTTPKFKVGDMVTNLFIQMPFEVVEIHINKDEIIYDICDGSVYIDIEEKYLEKIN